MMTQQDTYRLRELAKKQLALANSQGNQQRLALWKRHNKFQGERPTIHIEINTFQNEIIEPLLQCESAQARGMERHMLHQFTNQELFGDDKVVPDYYPVFQQCHFQLFGHTIARTVAKDSIGHQFQHIIHDLKEDFAKLTQESNMLVIPGLDESYQAELEEILGDILPVKLVMNCLGASPTQNVVHMMGMERMFFAMYDYPDLFKDMMQRIASDVTAYFRLLEEQQAILPMYGCEVLAQGSFCFWDAPPDGRPLKTSDVWGYLDSQETVGLSPEMFHEFIFPCYQQIASAFGRLSYGCCEPVHSFWEDIKTLPNLKKVSISPWCDEEYMAQELRGKDIIYLRKPSPNYLGVGAQMDESAFKQHIAHTLKTARGCHLEIAQRDVYTVNKDPNKVHRYVQLIREAIEQYW